MSQTASKPAPAPLFDDPLPIFNIVIERLQQIRGVDAAFLDNVRLYVVAREHGDVDREALLDVEDSLRETLGSFAVCVRAHQGRDVASLLPGLARIL